MACLRQTTLAVRRIGAGKRPPVRCRRVSAQKEKKCCSHFRRDDFILPSASDAVGQANRCKAYARPYAVGASAFKRKKRCCSHFRRDAFSLPSANDAVGQANRCRAYVRPYAVGASAFSRGTNVSRRRTSRGEKSIRCAPRLEGCTHGEFTRGESPLVPWVDC